MSKAVFVSHAVADQDLVRSFVDFLLEGIGVPEEAIFCSSLEGMGIPTGQNFVEYIRGQIDAPAVVIMLLTPSYRASSFCIAEMGAAWVKGHDVFPIIVPPTTYADVTGVMLGKQALMITDDIRINELRERLVAAAPCKPISATRWDLKRKAFFNGLPSLIAKLVTPKVIDPAEHDALEAKYQGALEEIEDRETQIDTLEQKLAAVSKLKDLSAVAAAVSAFEDADIGQEFEQRVAGIKRTLKPLGSSAVRRKLLADYYRQPLDVSGEDQEEFDAAIRRKYLDDDGRLNHRNAKVIALTSELKQLESFIAEGGEALETYCASHCKSPLETDNEEFWDEHFL